jgi:hypothetical protein
VFTIEAAGCFYCTVLYCSVLHYGLMYSVLHCTVLYCTVLSYNAVRCTVLCCTALYCNANYNWDQILKGISEQCQQCLAALYSVTAAVTAILYGGNDRFLVKSVVFNGSKIIILNSIEMCYVLYYTVMYCIVLLYYTVLYYCTILYCTVLYCTILYCTILYCTDWLI